MDATKALPIGRRRMLAGLIVFCGLVSGPLGLSVGVYAMQNAGPASATPTNPWLPYGDGTRDARNPNWSTDPADPFPMPPEFANAELMKQSA